MATTPVEALPSASGRPKSRDADWSDAWQTFDLKDSLSDRFARVPCQRKALILGLAGGGGVFFLRLFTSRRLQTAMNWGFPTLVVLSAASYHSCTRERIREEKLTRQIKERMDDIVDQKRSPSLEAPMAAKEGLKQPRPPRVVSKSTGLADHPEWLSAEEEWTRRGRGADPVAEAAPPQGRQQQQPEPEPAPPRRRGWFGLW